MIRDNEIIKAIFRFQIYLPFNCLKLTSHSIKFPLRVRLKLSISIFLFIGLLSLKPLHAQEMLGIVNSSYAGITGTVINPAVTVTSPFYIDFNLFAGDIFAENNYIYMAKEEYRFSRFFSKNPDYPTHGTNNSMIVYDYYNTKNKNAFASTRLMGPSLAVTIGRHSFGFVTGARAVSSSRNVPYDIAKFGFERREFPPLYGVNYADNQKIYNAELAWMENGINYSYVLKQGGLDYWAAGITVKDLRGYGGGYVYFDNVDYILPDPDTLIVHNVNGEAGYSLPLDYQTNEFIKNPLFRGKGIGIDLGIIYQKKKKAVQDERVSTLCDQSYTPYQYKIGISLLDIGHVKFTQNAQKLVLDNVSTTWAEVSSTNYSTVNDFTALLSNQFYGNPTEIVKGNEINIALPTALSVQADVNYYKNWFVNGTMVLPLQISKSGLRRPALLAVTPRYETSLFDISLPITLYDWTKPRIGLSARFLGFFVGTEKLGGFFHFADFTGLDFYFGVKISLRKGHCRGKKTDDNCGIEEYKMFRK